MVPNEHGGYFPREIVWESDGSRMVLIPHGTFTMGLSAARGGAPAEQPEREVYLPSFYIDKYEVSNRKYSRYVEQAAGQRPRPTGSPTLTHPDHPVCGVTWDAARGYARWTGRELPTEAMWEKAARGPENKLFTTGNTVPSREKVIFGRGPVGETVAVDRPTSDVSGYGVYHMGGNVSEWVSDWFERDYYKNAPRDNPRGPETGMSKVYRGGSFVTTQEDLRVTRRHAALRTQIRDEVGFRTVWVPASPREIAERTPTPTPQPTPEPRVQRQMVIDQFIEKLTPFIKDDAPQLPREMMATRAHASRGNSEIQFVNFTPWQISLNFISTSHELVFRYGEPLPRMTYRNVTLPREIDLQVLAYAHGAPRTGPIHIGMVRAESTAILVISTEFFGPVVDGDGNVTDIRTNTEVPQRYQGFSPQWNYVEAFNSTDEALLVRIEDVTRNLDDPTLVGEFTVESKHSFKMRLAPGRYRYSADYFGATDESSNRVTFRVDDRAARRLLHIQQDTGRAERVTVITQRKPFLAVELFEARRLPAPRAN